MPLWLPEEAAPHLKGFMFMSIDRAVNAGLSFRQLDDTIRDTLSWYKRERPDKELEAGIDEKKERTLLHTWHIWSLCGHHY
jgi:2'-hydroxyisoflavone reductase